MGSQAWAAPSGVSSVPQGHPTCTDCCLLAWWAMPDSCGLTWRLLGVPGMVLGSRACDRRASVVWTRRALWAYGSPLRFAAWPSRTPSRAHFPPAWIIHPAGLRSWLCRTGSPARRYARPGGRRGIPVSSSSARSSCCLRHASLVGGYASFGTPPRSSLVRGLWRVSAAEDCGVME